MHKLFDTIKHEILEIIPATIFFFIALTLLMITKYLLLREYGISVSGFGMIVIGSLLIAKVVLIVDHLKFVNRYPDKPLLYNVVWKACIYFIAALIIRYLEYLLPFITKYHGFIAANKHLLAEIIWPHFWLIQIWLAVLLLLFCTLRELVRAIGREKFIHMFLGGGMKI